MVELSGKRGREWKGSKILVRVHVDLCKDNPEGDECNVTC